MENESRSAISPRTLWRRMALTEIFYNFCFASSNYRTVFLQELGFGTGRIGLVASLSSVVGIFASPVFGVLSDKIRSVKLSFILCLSLSAILMLFVPVAVSAGAGGSYAGVFAILVFSALFTGPAMDMMENWLVQIDLRYREVSYGSMRIWASLAFAAMSLIYVPVLKHIATSWVYVLYFLFALPAIGIALCVPSFGGSGAGKRQRLRDMPFREVINRPFIIFLIFSMLHNIPSNWKNTYFIYILNLCGYDSKLFGLFMCVSACFEVPALLMSRRAVDKYGPVKPMLVSYLLIVAEAVLLASAHSIVPILIAQLFKGASAGMLYACQIRYIYRISPDGLHTTAQTLVSSFNSIVSIVASAAGGFLLAAMGTRPFFLVIAVMEAAALVYFALNQKGKNVVAA